MKKSTTLKAEWIEIVNQFDPQIRGEIWDAVINYQFFNVIPENLSETAKMAFLFIKLQIDKARIQREKAKARRIQKQNPAPEAENQPTTSITPSAPATLTLPSVPNPPISKKRLHKSSRKKQKSRAIKHRHYPLRA